MTCDLFWSVFAFYMLTIVTVNGVNSILNILEVYSRGFQVMHLQPKNTTKLYLVLEEKYFDYKSFTLHHTFRNGLDGYATRKRMSKYNLELNFDLGFDKPIRLDPNAFVHLKYDVEYEEKQKDVKKIYEWTTRPFYIHYEEFPDAIVIDTFHRGSNIESFLTQSFFFEVITMTITWFVFGFIFYSSINRYFSIDQTWR